MKTLTLGLALALGMAAPALADPVIGTWQTEPDDGSFAYIQMQQCGEVAICGTISRTFNSEGEYKSGNIGKKLVWDMEPRGNGKYRDGMIWQPSSDKVFSSKMVLSGDTLKVSGCFGPICKRQTWQRVR
mgnify:FL=1